MGCLCLGGWHKLIRVNTAHFVVNVTDTAGADPGFDQGGGPRS